VALSEKSSKGVGSAVDTELRDGAGSWFGTWQSNRN